MGERKSIPRGLKFDGCQRGGYLLCQYLGSDGVPIDDKYVPLEDMGANFGRRKLPAPTDDYDSSEAYFEDRPNPFS